jgi:hypothetical protein
MNEMRDEARLAQADLAEVRSELFAAIERRPSRRPRMAGRSLGATVAIAAALSGTALAAGGATGLIPAGAIHLPDGGSAKEISTPPPEAGNLGAGARHHYKIEYPAKGKYPAATMYWNTDQDLRKHPDATGEGIVQIHGDSDAPNPDPANPPTIVSPSPDGN